MINPLKHCFFSQGLEAAITRFTFFRPAEVGDHENPMAVATLPIKSMGMGGIRKIHGRSEMCIVWKIIARPGIKMSIKNNMLGCCD